MSAHLFRAMILSISVTGVAAAQEAESDPETSVSAQLAPTSQTRTGKERLGAKWTDEQRVNNCGVPPDKRGDTPRPNRCASEESE
ncbi:hypothetical protein SAMN05421538_1156 [Paracoccus isoporae]|uniref:Uncharacterized protein n=1 Tax=Paracoccus isoporae TaxID=591205 RepID=A0A1G7GU93_9RHOB|nr:hypothetical protein SAMN05421538_1156 [Paracoccus isoporae]